MKNMVSVISALLIIVIYSVLLYLSKQASLINESGNNFVVKFPKILDWAARLCASGGVVFVLVFLYKVFRKDPKISSGHFLIGAAFVIIGIVLEVVYARWNIVVNGNILTCNRFFKSSTNVSVEELDEINLTGDIIRLSINGKVITYVDKDCDNFDKLCGKLSEYGKID